MEKKNTVLEKVIARDQCGQMTSNLVYKLWFIILPFNLKVLPLLSCLRERFPLGPLEVKPAEFRGF